MKREFVNCITINTDASFSHQKKIGGYAFYIVCNSFKIKKTGIFKYNPKSSIDAEMMCMGNAIHTLLTNDKLPLTRLIVINSDCLNSFPLIDVESKNKIGKKVANLLEKLILKVSDENKIKTLVDFRHVKAHTKTKDKRSYINNWCDKEAKKAMRIASSKI